MNEKFLSGHLDKIKIKNTNEKFFSEEESWYREETVKAIDAILDAGVIVEVNTRELQQQKSSTTYPSLWILEIPGKKNVPILISSDASHPDDLVNQFSETARMQQKIGFKKLVTLHERKWRHFKFSSNGVAIS